MTAENYLIQSLMWRQCLTEDKFKQMVGKCQRDLPEGSEVSAEMMGQMVAKVNRQLRPYNIEISRGPNESDGTIHYALINTADNDITRMASIWTQKELIYYKKVVTAIVESDTTSITWTKLLNIGRNDEMKLTVSAAENLMNKWMDQKWFEELSDGNIAIGVRSLLEMNVYIRDHFDVKDCLRCKILCVRGLDCMSCSSKLHYHCSDSQYIQDNKCPNCHKQFADTEHMNSGTTADNRDEDVDSDSDDTVVEDNPSGQRGRSKR